jgi:hypothetical protein
MGSRGSDRSKTIDINDSRSDRSPESECRDEDCCFGCAHVLSSAAVSAVAVFDMKSIFVGAAQQFIPEPPLRTTYHPPRFVLAFHTLSQSERAV